MGWDGMGWDGMGRSLVIAQLVERRTVEVHKFSVGRVFESPSRDLKQSKHDENVVSIVFI